MQTVGNGKNVRYIFMSTCLVGREEGGEALKGDVTASGTFRGVFFSFVARLGGNEMMGTADSFSRLFRSWTMASRSLLRCFAWA